MRRPAAVRAAGVGVRYHGRRRTTLTGARVEGCIGRFLAPRSPACLLPGACMSSKGTTRDTLEQPRRAVDGSPGADPCDRRVSRVVPSERSLGDGSDLADAHGAPGTPLLCGGSSSCVDDHRIATILLRSPWRPVACPQPYKPYTFLKALLETRSENQYTCAGGQNTSVQVQSRTELLAALARRDAGEQPLLLVALPPNRRPVVSRKVRDQMRPARPCGRGGEFANQAVPCTWRSCPIWSMGRASCASRADSCRRHGADRRDMRRSNARRARDRVALRADSATIRGALSSR